MLGVDPGSGAPNAPPPPKKKKKKKKYFFVRFLHPLFFVYISIIFMDKS
jgi:hypothetical protein